MASIRRLGREHHLKPVGPRTTPDTSDGLGDNAPVGRQELHRINFSKALTPPVDASLDFALMAATRHAERGEHQAFVTAICDAFWLQHTGSHEQVSDNRMVTLLRGIAGLSWEPPTGGEAA